MSDDRLGCGFFTVRSQWFYRWPIIVHRGHDEYRRRTFGIRTWPGGIYYAWPCNSEKCECYEWSDHG